MKSNLFLKITANFFAVDAWELGNGSMACCSFSCLTGIDRFESINPFRCICLCNLSVCSFLNKRRQSPWLHFKRQNEKKYIKIKENIFVDGNQSLNKITMNNVWLTWKFCICSRSEIELFGDEANLIEFSLIKCTLHMTFVTKLGMFTVLFVLHLNQTQMRA